MRSNLLVKFNNKRILFYAALCAIVAVLTFAAWQIKNQYDNYRSEKEITQQNIQTESEIKNEITAKFGENAFKTTEGINQINDYLDTKIADLDASIATTSIELGLQRQN